MARQYFSDAARAKYEPVAIAGNTALVLPVAPKNTTGKQQSKANDPLKYMRIKVQIAKTALLRTLPGFDDDVYRAILQENYGASSSKDLDRFQLHSLLLHFASLGWEKKAGKQRKGAPKALNSDTVLNREALLAKIEAQLTEKGRAEGTEVPWAYAIGILKRQSGGVTKSLDQADRKQLEGVIAALWRDAKRHGRLVR